MRKILLPLEQTDRSLKALQYFRKHYSPEEAAVVLLMVDEELPYSATQEEEAAAVALLKKKLELISGFLKGYEIHIKAEIGKAGQRICKCAREYGVSLIAMTKSSREDMLSKIGKTAEYVIVNAPCNVCIVSEIRDSGEYRGLVYTKAQSVVNLRGQGSDKQSECLLPNVAADCNYHLDVSVGRVRFYHTSYNPHTGLWDMPPKAEQEYSVDLAAGDSVDILVKPGVTDGKTDRIRVINRDMKQEAVFNYLITPVLIPAVDVSPSAEYPVPEEDEAVAAEAAESAAETPAPLEVEEAVDEAPVAAEAAEPAAETPAPLEVEETVDEAPVVAEAAEPAAETPAPLEVEEAVYNETAPFTVAEAIFEEQAPVEVTESAYEESFSAAVAEPIFEEPFVDAAAEPIYEESPAAEAQIVDKYISAAPYEEPVIDRVVVPIAELDTEKDESFTDKFFYKEEGVAASPLQMSETVNDIPEIREAEAPTTEDIDALLSSYLNNRG